MLLILSIITIFIVSSSVTTPISPKTTSGELKNQNRFIWETCGCPRYIDPIDPATNYESYGNTIIEFIYEGLIGYKGNSVAEIEGKLATSWIISPDGLKYFFNLKNNVTFHDGVVFNAYIMKYSIDRAILMADPYGPSWMLAQVIRGGAAYMDYDNPNVTEALAYLDAGGVVVVDEFTLAIILDFAYSPFIHTLAYTVASAVSPRAVIENEPSVYNTNVKDHDFGMVPLDEWFEDLTDLTKLGLKRDIDPKNSGVVPGSYPQGPAGHVWMGKNAVGSGPYILKSLNKDTVLLKKNTNWWGSFASHAVDVIEIKTVSDDERRIQDLKSGDADMAFIGHLDASKVIKSTGESIFEGVNAYTTSMFQNSFLCMNMRESLSNEFLSESVASTYNASEHFRYASNHETASPNNPFTALLFRKAIVTAFDYTTYINQGVTGISEQMEGIIPKNMFGHHDLLIENGNLPTYNLEVARALFKTVGWKGTIKISYSAESDVSALAFQLLAKSIVLCDVGIEVLLQPMDPVNYDKALMTMEMPMYYNGWVADYADPDNFVTPYLHGRYGFFSTQLKINDIQLNNLIEKAVIEQNIDTRQQLYYDIEELAAKDCFYVYLSQNHRITVVRDWIQNIEESGSLNPMSSAPKLQYCNKIYSSYDKDGDGMPDLWEIQMGLNASDASDASDDIDADWVLNIDEYRGGSDPRDFWSIPLFCFSIFHMGLVVILCIFPLVIGALRFQKEKQKRGLIALLKAPDYSTALKIQKFGFSDYITLVQTETQAKTQIEIGHTLFLQGKFFNAIHQYEEALDVFELLEREELVAETLFRIAQVQKEIQTLNRDSCIFQRFPRTLFGDASIDAFYHMIEALLAETEKNWGSAKKDWEMALNIKKLNEKYQVICLCAIAESEFYFWLSNPTEKSKEELFIRLDKLERQCERKQYLDCLCIVYLLRARIDLATFQFEGVGSWLKQCLKVAENAEIKLYYDIAIQENENLLQLKKQTSSLLQLEAPLTQEEQVKRVQEYVRDALGIKKAQQEDYTIEEPIRISREKT